MMPMLRDGRFAGYLLTAGLAIGLASVAAGAASAPFSRFLGALPPVAVMLGVAAAGAVALLRLLPVGWAGQSALPPARDGALLGALALAFAVPTIWVDTVAPWPRDINAPLPEALAFYPAIALVAETVFHLVPLALCSLLLPRRFWTAAICVAMIEPAFQVLAEIGSDAPPWRHAYMALHLTAFNLVQIAALRRYGIVTAYGFRVIYYAAWHVGWGAVRLDMLFGA